MRIDVYYIVLNAGSAYSFKLKKDAEVKYKELRKVSSFNVSMSKATRVEFTHVETIK